jgi:peptidoglycan/LPS O-acetylase OafA/YrhL
VVAVCSIGVTWYLACDFLFFCATPFVLLIDRKDRRLSLTVLMGLLTAGMIGCGLYSHDHGVRSNEFLNQVDADRGQAWSHLYFRPYTRAGPYIVGILLALCCDHVDLYHASFKFRPLTSMLLQLCGGLVCLFVVFIPYDEIRSVGCFPPQCAVADMKINWSQATSDIYNAVSRPLFAVGLSCVAAAIMFGQPVKGGGFVTWLLSQPVMSVLGKLSFHAYLWHFLFIRWYYTQQVSPFDYTWFNMLVWWLGFTYIAFTMALLSYLVVELPFSELTARVTSKLERRSKAMPQPQNLCESKA